MSEENPVPDHVAIIMDGNGRWAEERGLNRTEGHKNGVKSVRIITKISANYGIKFLTLFTFSTENWKRGTKEVNFLFHLLVDSINTYIPELHENGVKINFIGDIDPLPLFVKNMVQFAAKTTQNNNRIVLNIALNYGSRREIVQVVEKLLLLGTTHEITEETFKQFLYTKDQPDPDLIIRTGGEKRLSNFLLYQSAYSELVFTDTLWPDFTEKEYLQILREFSTRTRKYGALK
ncbi:MAG: polyprenyl diphosphate synthase [Caldisericota bacterium]|nr:polyprenyl diphosphate synthase [Caldisericota bacterium]